METYQTLNAQHDSLRDTIIAEIQKLVAAGEYIRNYVVIGKTLVSALHSDWATMEGNARPIMYHAMETGTLLEILRNLTLEEG